MRIHDRFLSGFIWGENVGWINVGDADPADGVRYANTDGDDIGVNLDANGDLFGLAWGENVGWPNFDTRDKGAERARFDLEAGRFRGFVRGENVGWINLDDDVDLADLTVFQGCFTGVGGGPLGPFCSRCFDFDADDDVAVADFLSWQAHFTGSR